jgi:hypothetical protein
VLVVNLAQLGQTRRGIDLVCAGERTNVPIEAGLGSDESDDQASLRLPMPPHVCARRQHFGACRSVLAALGTAQSGDAVESTGQYSVASGHARCKAESGGGALAERGHRPAPPERLTRPVGDLGPTCSSCSTVCSRRSVTFEKVPLSRPFILSSLPLCHGERGSQKIAPVPASAVISGRCVVRSPAPG